MEDTLPWEGPHAAAGEECEEEGAAKTTYDELTAVPILPLPCATRGETVEKIKSEVEPRKKEGVGGSCFKIWFYFFLRYSDLINK